MVAPLDSLPTTTAPLLGLAVMVTLASLLLLLVLRCRSPKSPDSTAAQRPARAPASRHHQPKTHTQSQHHKSGGPPRPQPRVPTAPPAFASAALEDSPRLYSPRSRIIVLGDGDLTFSASLARSLAMAAQAAQAAQAATPRGQRHGRPPPLPPPLQLVCSTYDTAQAWEEKYSRSVARRTATAAVAGVRIEHGVDATQLDTHETVARLGGRHSFDRVIFNFPHAGWVGHSSDEREESATMVFRQRTLMMGTLAAAGALLAKEGGELHLRLKTGSPYCCWGMQQLVTDAGWAIVGSAPFAAKHWPSYSPVYGAGRRSHRRFSPQDARLVVLVRRTVDGGGSAKVVGVGGASGGGGAGKNDAQRQRRWRCDICDVDAATDALLLPHLMGSRHCRAVAKTVHRV